MTRHSPAVCRAARESFRLHLAVAAARREDGQRAIRFEAAANLALPAPTMEAARIDAARVLGAWAAAAVLRVRERRAARHATAPE